MPVFLYPAGADDLAPLCRLRPPWEVVVGARTIREKWIDRFPRLGVAAAPGAAGPGLYIDGRALPFDVAEDGPPETGVLDDGTVVYVRGDGTARRVIEARLVRRPWDAVRFQAEEIRADLRALGAVGASIDDGAFVHPTAVLDVSDGPVLVEKGAKVGAHAVVVGPSRIGREAVVHPLALVRGSNIGEGSRVGGEVSASTLVAFVNKQHHGFLGHSYICPWVNIGAGATTSNLKNNYGEVRCRGEKTGLTFLGSIIGDHAKIGINASLPTGCVVGVSANVFGAGTLPKEVPDFAWGGPEAGWTVHRLEEALETAETVMGRRDRTLTDDDRRALEAAYPR